MIYFTINPVDAAAAAEIHASIFSIIVGFIFAYALYHYGKKHELEIQIIQESSKINIISLLGRTLQMPGHEDFDTSHLIKRKNTLERLKMTGMESHSYEEFIDIKKFPVARKTKSLPETSSERGKLTLSDLYAIYTHYPFACYATSMIGVEIHHPIKFSNVKDVKIWIKDLEDCIRPILWTLDSFGNIHQVNFNAVGEGFSVKNYIQVALISKDLLQSVKSQLAQYEANKSDKSIIVLGFVISLLGFLCGVVIPLFFKDSDPAIYLVIPIICYIVIFIYLSYFISEK